MAPLGKLFGRQILAAFWAQNALAPFSRGLRDTRPLFAFHAHNVSFPFGNTGNLPSLTFLKMTKSEGESGRSFFLNQENTGVEIGVFSEVAFSCSRSNPAEFRVKS